VLQRISQLQEMFGPKVTAATASDALLKCGDDIDAAAVMLMTVSDDRGLPPLVASGSEAAAPAVAQRCEVKEQPTCVICMMNPPTHAFIPCGHKQLCHECAADDRIVEGLHKNCPVCRRQFQCIVQIFDSS
jgi:hypothetical protein